MHGVRDNKVINITHEWPGDRRLSSNQSLKQIDSNGTQNADWVEFAVFNTFDPRLYGFSSEIACPQVGQYKAAIALPYSES